MTLSKRAPVAHALLFAVLIVLCAIIALPLLWMIATSLRDVRDSFSLPPRFIPLPPFAWENYRVIFQLFPFARFVMNSIVVTAVGVGIQVIVSSMAAYALTRIPFRGASVAFVLIIACLMIPGQITVIPLFIAMSRVGLVDTRLALILIGIPYPLGLFLLRQYFLTIPKSYDEAACIDGASRIQICFRILFPQIRPAIAVVALMHGLLLWNDFFRPLIFLYSAENMTLPLGLVLLQGQFGLAGGISPVLAGAALSIVLPVTAFLFGQRYIAEGAKLGGLKA